MLRRAALSGVIIGVLTSCARPEAPRAPFDPVAQDPVAIDVRYPMENRVVAIPSAGASMNGVLLVAQGAGPHPTVVLLHGLPGQGGNRDLAETIRRAGWNVLTFQYRGAWGSEGTFSLANVLVDVSAAVVFVRGAEGTSARCSPDGIVLVGHSMGGWAALIATARDQRVHAVASIAGWNVGRFGRSLVDPQRFAAEVKDNERVLPPLRGTSAISITREEATNAEEWDLVGYVPQLVNRPVLLIAGQRDAVTPIPENHAPVVAEFTRLAAQHVSDVVLDADHAFSDRRVSLARQLVAWLASLSVAPVINSPSRQ